MTREQWATLQDLLIAALEEPEGERGAFLSRACDGDEELRLEVESLLDAHSSSGPLDRLAHTLGAGLVTELVDGEGFEGDAVGRYEIRERLGRGGMGIVYRAWDPKLERDVALKCLPGLMSSDPASRHRLLVEAQLAAGLEHVNICTIHEIGEAEDGRLFIAMPLYDGETLRAKLKSGPLGENEAVPLALDAARGLARAHAQGVIHRDIKPGNLMVTRDGTLKILDFGIAQASGGSTHSEHTPGTTHYMSPEQVAGGSVDGRSDLWSLGVVLYEMLTGRRPFEGRTQAEVRSAVTQEEPVALEKLVPTVSPALGSLVRALLRKDPSQRPASATDVLQTLRRIANGSPVRRDRRRRRRLVTAAAILVCAASAGGGIALASPDRTPSQTVSSEARAAFVRGVYLQRLYQEEGEPDTLLLESVQALSRAAELEPEWADAQAELARAYHWLASGPSGARSGEYYRAAKTAAQTAIRLDESLAGGHAALAFVLQMHERDWSGAEREYRRAMELSPSDSYYRWGWGLFEMNAGRYEAAVTDLQWAFEQAPLSPALHSQLAHALACAGRDQEAEALLGRFAEDDPGVLLFRGEILLRRGEEERAVTLLERAASDSTDVALEALAHAYASVGRDRDARALLPVLQARGAWLPGVYAALGEPQRAIDELERAYDQEFPGLVSIRCFGVAAFRDLTTMEGLAGDPRMQELLQRIDFPE